MQQQADRARAASIVKSATDECMKYVEKNRHAELVNYLQSLR